MTPGRRCGWAGGKSRGWIRSAAGGGDRDLPERTTADPCDGAGHRAMAGCPRTAFPQSTHDGPGGGPAEPVSGPKTLGEVEWVTIFFFIDLFVMVSGIETAGGVEMVGRSGRGADRRRLAVPALAILWASALASAMFDNIPFVATGRPSAAFTRSSHSGGHWPSVPVWVATARSSAPAPT